MKARITSTQWRLTRIALGTFVGVVIGGFIASLLFNNINAYYVLGALSVSILLIIINVISVIYKKMNRNDNDKHDVG
ncbi:hypothetical protein [Thalassobacillus hwangdonensis]|uniref:Major facilitator superfamily (MFS) profile domain-containing protein n=1 Tax=Thalassobacillus hwangdonensis TaxID=546108 RepID=A0ABW3L784_9BACI